MCAFWWLWDSVPWVEIMCGWVCVHAWGLVHDLSMWDFQPHELILVPPPTAMPPEHTHMLSGPRTMRWGYRGDWPQTLIMTIPGTKSALIDWLQTHLVLHTSPDDIGWSKNFKTIKIPAIYALICFDLSGGKGVSRSRKTSSGTNTNAFLIHNLLASSRKKTANAPIQNQIL